MKLSTPCRETEKQNKVKTLRSLPQIERYNELHDSIDQCESQHCINGWLALDLKPLKHGLLNLACKWSHLFKKWLLRYVQRTLQVSVPILTLLFFV